MARRMPVSYSGPREDVSLKALGGYAPSALQTDILPRSRVGDRYSLVFIVPTKNCLNLASAATTTFGLRHIKSYLDHKSSE